MADYICVGGPFDNRWLSLGVTSTLTFSLTQTEEGITRYYRGYYTLFDSHSNYIHWIAL